MINEWSSTIVNSIFDIILVVDHDLKILDTNSAVQEYGYRKEDLLGQTFLDLTVDNASVRKAIPELVATAKRGVRELRRFEAIKSDGTKFWVDLSANEIEATEATDFLLVLHDVDERAKARQQLEEQKTRIEDALREAESLRRDAESNRVKLELANQQLSDRQKIVEDALREEQKFRLTSQKTNFQKNFAVIMACLVAFALLLPYASAFTSLSEKLIDTTGNLSLLLIQTLGIIAGALFQSRQKDGGGSD